MVGDLVDRVVESVTKTVTTKDIKPVLDALIELKASYRGSVYTDPESFIDNKGLRIASNNVITYRKMLHDDATYHCLAVDFQECPENKDAVREVLEKTLGLFEHHEEVFIVDHDRLIVGISAK